MPNFFNSGIAITGSGSAVPAACLHNQELTQLVEYLPITTTVMRQAAFFWAQARQQGQPTAGDKTIDGDIILVAQAVTLNVADFLIATTNVGHLSRFVTADLWQNIHIN